MLGTSKDNINSSKFTQFHLVLTQGTYISFLSEKIWLSYDYSLLQGMAPQDLV
jgi:hypothetical protein